MSNEESADLREILARMGLPMSLLADEAGANRAAAAQATEDAHRQPAITPPTTADEPECGFAVTDCIAPVDVCPLAAQAAFLDLISEGADRIQPHRLSSTSPGTTLASATQNPEPTPIDMRTRACDICALVRHLLRECPEEAHTCLQLATRITGKLAAIEDLPLQSFDGLAVKTPRFGTLVDRFVPQQIASPWEQPPSLMVVQRSRSATPAKELSVEELRIMYDGFVEGVVRMTDGIGHDRAATVQRLLSLMPWYVPPAEVLAMADSCMERMERASGAVVREVDRRVRLLARLLGFDDIEWCRLLPPGVLKQLVRWIDKLGQPSADQIRTMAQKCGLLTKEIDIWLAHRRLQGLEVAKPLEQSDERATPVVGQQLVPFRLTPSHRPPRSQANVVCNADAKNGQMDNSGPHRRTGRPSARLDMQVASPSTPMRQATNAANEYRQDRSVQGRHAGDQSGCGMSHERDDTRLLPPMDPRIHRRQSADSRADNPQPLASPARHGGQSPHVLAASASHERSRSRQRHKRSRSTFRDDTNDDDWDDYGARRQRTETETDVLIDWDRYFEEAMQTLSPMWQ